ncbi:MAG TPA: hypothetical protein PK191_06875 [Niabella sp.]|nr:hypothetical protein [Niabella sp.]HOZ95740.1 hypothetical protein [Niabella sp.]HQW15983.1 hypothetical protein [Niabella sp.]HQX21164.1 hypothetical protein [Niabella sp.]HQX40745.1 hypothetical protein [Niabella sp.]
MNRMHFPLLFIVFALVCLFNSCKKESNEPAKEPPYRKGWVTGKWKQKDLVISVTAKLGSTKIPAGTSMIALAPMLGQALGNPALASMIICTKDNQYEFNAQGGFTVTGCTDFILPKAGGTGKWDLKVYDAILELISQKNENDPHWINSITSSKMELALTINIPGVGNVPMGLQLEKVQ